jgi:hypothetical protein
MNEKTTGLPPGPWTLLNLDHDSFDAVVDADGDEIVSVDGLDAGVVACERVRLAIVALPALAEAARDAEKSLRRGGLIDALISLRHALALIDEPAIPQKKPEGG